MADPRLNLRYERPAKDALAAARDNLKAGKAAAAAGSMNQAVASVVDAGEEAAKSILYQLAYLDIVTFDEHRAGERLYLFDERRLRDHDPKQVSVVAIAGLLLAVLLLILYSLSEVFGQVFGQKLPTANLMGMIKSEAPGLVAVVTLSERFEELRQSRYSGAPKTGVRGPRVTTEEFDNLLQGVDEVTEFVANLQDGNLWKPEDLGKAQEVMPATVKEFGPPIDKLRETFSRPRRS